MTCGIVDLSFFWEFPNSILGGHAAVRYFSGAWLDRGPFGRTEWCLSNRQAVAAL